MYVKWFVNNPGYGQEALELHFRLKRLFGLNLRNHCRSHKPINVSILASWRELFILLFYYLFGLLIAGRLLLKRICIVLFSIVGVVKIGEIFFLF